MMEDAEIWIGMLVGLAILAGGCYGTYSLGRRLERRDLTSALIKSVEETYYEGFHDGNLNCKQNLDVCHEALIKCQDE